MKSNDDSKELTNVTDVELQRDEEEPNVGSTTNNNSPVSQPSDEIESDNNVQRSYDSYDGLVESTESSNNSSSYDEEMLLPNTMNAVENQEIKPLTVTTNISNYNQDGTELILNETAYAESDEDIQRIIMASIHSNNESLKKQQHEMFPLTHPQTPTRSDTFQDDQNTYASTTRRTPIHTSASHSNLLSYLASGADPLSTGMMGEDAVDEEAKQNLEMRLRDFRFAQNRRQDKYGRQSPWGILGLYDHLSGIRTDVEWAEDAAWRRQNRQPYLSWKDFEEAKDTGFNKPFFTYIVMFVCTVCLIVSIGVNDWKIEPLKVNPMVGPSADTLILMGAKQTSLIVVEKQWYRLFSPMVLHAGIIHYLLNMLALWFIGSAVEQNHGFFAAALLFIVPAFGGTVLSALFLPEYISVGASGGIFGLIGACLADIVSNWNLLFSKEVNSIDNGVRFRHAKVLLWLLLDIIVNILIGMTPFVDNFTHLGGMVYGFLFGLSALERLSKAFFGVSTSCFSNVMAYVIKFAGAIISIVCIIVSVVILFSGSKVTCRGCRYVSCVPFPFWADQEDRWWYCDDCELVTAEAVMNEATQYYSSLNLTCPDKAVVSIDLTNLEISDGHWLEKQLPTYCRRNCEQVYN